MLGAYAVRSRLHVLTWLSALTIAVGIGCAASDANLELRPDAFETATSMNTEEVRADPVSYLRAVTERCRALEQYTLLFTRHERRGFFKMMHGPEHIRCWFRREPFSIRMKWQDTHLKYNESVYVAGEYNDQVRFVTRWWNPPLRPPPGVNRVSLSTPVFWGESQRPLTDFGLERLMERTLAATDRAGAEAEVRYEALVRLRNEGPPVHFIRIEVPTKQSRTPVQELYIDADTNLPAGTVLRRASGDVNAAYFYEDLDTNVTLTDNDFLLPAEREERASES